MSVYGDGRMYEIQVMNTEKNKVIFYGKYDSLNMLVTHLVKLLVPNYKILIQNKDDVKE